jgi:hypothetical protein
MIRIEAYSENLAVRTEKPDLEQVTHDKERLFPGRGWMSGVLDNDDGASGWVGKSRWSGVPGA